MPSRTVTHGKAGALVRTWLLLDFFGDARRAGRGQASSLTTTIFSQAFLAFVLAALLHGDTPPVAYAAANLCLSSLFVAIGALGDEARPERRAADELLLHSAPLRPLTIALARGAHAAFAIVLVTVGMALSPAILLALGTGSAWQFPAYIAGACLCSALAAGALGVVARASQRWLGGNRTALLLGSVKALALGGGLVLFALGLTRLRGTAADLPIGRTGADLLPPYQVARWLAAPGEWWRMLALLGAGAVLLAAAATLARGAGPVRERVARGGPARWLLRRLAPPGPNRALAEYTAVQMWRSAGFRARVLPLLGVPAAMVALTVRGGESRNDFVLACVLLQLPAIYLPFLVMFLPRADQPGTRWLFDHAPRVPLAAVRDAAWRAVVTHVLLPVFVLATGFAAAAPASLTTTVPAALFALGLAVFAAHVALHALDDVPFTDARDPEGGPDLGALFASAIVLGGAGAAFALVPPPAWRWPIAVAALAAAALALVRRRAGPGEAEAPAHPAEPADAGPHSDAEPAAMAASGSDDPRAGEPGAEDGAAAAPAVPSLRRELRAIATLYVFLSILPLLVGTFFAA